MNNQSPKRASAKRFELANHIFDKVAPTLPKPAHVAILAICWRHARQGGAFRVSSRRLAMSSRLSERHVKRILDDLETGQVIELLEEHQGPIPRRYRITGKPLMVTPTSP